VADGEVSAAARERASAYGVLLVGAAGVVLAHWPGAMNVDTLGTIAFVRTGVIGDQLSPVLTWAWRQAYLATGAGPGVVLVLQTTALAAGLYLVLRAAFGRIAASILAVLVLVAPPAFGLVGLIGRDAWFVSGCLLATGLGVGAVRWAGRSRRAAIVGGVAAALVAVAARQNGFTAVAPIMVGLAVPALAAFGKAESAVGRHRAIAAVALGVGATLAMAAATNLTGSAIRDQRWHPEVYTYLYDLAYLTVEEDRRFIPRLPRDVQPLQAPDEIREHWIPSTGVSMRVGPELELDLERWLRDPRQTHVFARDTTVASRPAAPLPWHYDDEQAELLGAAWRTAVLDNPVTYLSGRLAQWKRLIGVGHPPTAAFVDAVPANPFGYRPRPSFPVLSDAAARWADVWSGPGTNGSAVHRVWPYLLVCLIGLGFLLPRFPAPVRMVGVLMAAAAGLQVGLFFLSPSVELRFQLLTLYSAMVAVAVAARMAYSSSRRGRQEKELRKRGYPHSHRPVSANQTGQGIDSVRSMGGRERWGLRSSSAAAARLTRSALAIVVVVALGFAAEAQAASGDGGDDSAGKPTACLHTPVTLSGGQGPDRLVGTPGPDVIAGGGGDDRIVGLGGDDLICGGTGHDRVVSGRGADLVLGGSGRDSISAGRGNDVVRAGAGRDLLRGGPHLDRCHGGAGLDQRFGCESMRASQGRRNHRPTARRDARAVGKRGSALVRVTVNDTDPDGNSLRVTSIGTKGTVGRVELTRSGQRVRYRPDGRFDHLGPSETATDSFTYVVSDRRGGSDAAKVTITVVGRGVPPIAHAPQPGDPPPVDPPSLDVSTDPQLLPDFAPDVSDYAVRCTGEPLPVSVSMPPGSDVSVDDQPFRGGAFSTTVGLQANQAFDVVVRTGEASEDYHVRCLPPSFPAWNYTRLRQPHHSFYAITPSAPPGRVVIFDDHGAPVWWYESEVGAINASVLSDGTVAYSSFFGGGFGRDPRSIMHVRGLDGSLVREIEAVGGPIDTHELQTLPNGNILVISYQPRPIDLSAYCDVEVCGNMAFDGVIQELDPQGQLVWSWNALDHIDLSEVAPNYWPIIAFESPVDVIHMNAVEPDGSDHVLISNYLTDSVYRIHKATGDIVWKLGGTPTPESLEVLGDAHGDYPLAGQHDVRRQADGTVTIHDNHLGGDPRAVRYAIDETSMTATLVEEIRDPETVASRCCGSARRSADGSWLMSWGMNSLVTEFDALHRRTFRLTLGEGLFSYRAVSSPSGALDIEALRAGMDSMHPR